MPAKKKSVPHLPSIVSAPMTLLTEFSFTMNMRSESVHIQCEARNVHGTRNANHTMASTIPFGNTMEYRAALSAVIQMLYAKLSDNVPEHAMSDVAVQGVIDTMIISESDLIESLAVTEIIPSQYGTTAYVLTSAKTGLDFSYCYDSERINLVASHALAVFNTEGKYYLAPILATNSSVVSTLTNAVRAKINALTIAEAVKLGL